MGSYLAAFLVGGVICAIGQLILEYTKMTPAHVVVFFTIAGAILSGLGVYQQLLEWAGAGALIPVSGFGNAVTAGIVSEARRSGWIGLFTGAFELTGLGVTAAVVFGFLAALVSSPRGT
ncbi:MAG: stage V sporulation protein AE [Bacteroidota bacterium]